MKSVDHIVRRVILLCAILLLAPEALLLVKHIVRDAVSEPSTGARIAGSSGGGGFGTGVLVGFVAIILFVGLLARLGTFLRDRDPYGRALDRRSRAAPRYPAEVDPEGTRATEPDDDPALS